LGIAIGTGLALDLDFHPCDPYGCTTQQHDEAVAGLTTLVIGVVGLAIGIPVYVIGGRQMSKAKLLPPSQPAAF
jgi:hypothetical protein